MWVKFWIFRQPSTVNRQPKKRLFHQMKQPFKNILSAYFLEAGFAAGAAFAPAAPAGAPAAGAPAAAAVPAGAAPVAAVVSSCFNTRVNTMEATGILGEFRIS